MIVKKILNNNVITSVGEDGQEIIIVGKGIGWKQKTGDPIDETKIDKIFRMDTATSTARLKQLFLEVRVESIQASSDIVDHARKTLDKELKKNIYITLTDHIDFAVERCEKGIAFQTALFWEIRKIYPKEYAVGQYALGIIRDRLGAELPEEEAAAIALHLINAEMDGNMNRTQSMIDIVNKSLDIVRVLLDAEFDEDSLDYQRFVTHLLFFAQRALEQKSLESSTDFLHETMRQGYPKEFLCARKILDYVRHQYGLAGGEAEITFLTVHIVRVTRREAAE